LDTQNNKQFITPGSGNIMHKPIKHNYSEQEHKTHKISPSSIYFKPVHIYPERQLERTHVS